MGEPVSAFDDCTLAEVEMMTNECLNGKNMGDEHVDPMMIAGGVMWIIARRDDPELAWSVFKARVRMGDIKAFSIQMEADEMDPTQPLPVPT